MQFPTIPPQKVIPVVRTDVTPVAPVKPVAGSEQQAISGSSQSGTVAEPAAEGLPAAERRQGLRRDTRDRRRRQVPVLLDTRTGRDRRGERRRVDDPPPARLDESA